MFIGIGISLTAQPTPQAAAPAAPAAPVKKKTTKAKNKRSCT